MRSPRKAQRAINQMVLYLGVAVIVVFMVLYLLFHSFHHSRMATMEKLVQNIADQYEASIDLKMTGDLRILETLGSLLNISDPLAMEETLRAQTLDDDINTFVSIGYIDSQYQAMLCYQTDDSIHQVDMQDYPEVTKALSGKTVITDLIQDPYTDTYMSYYLVPIRRDEQVVGALIASNHVIVLHEIIEDPILNSGGLVHLIHDDGTYILPPRETLVPNQTTNVFETYGAHQQVLDRLSNHQDDIEPFHYMNEDYLVMFKYLNINDWYLVCVIPQSALGTNYFILFLLILLLSIVLLIIFGLFAFYMYRTLTANSKELSRLALHDQLTGLYNTYRFKQEVKARLDKRPSGVVILNIYHFRFVNELLGYSQANEVLMMIGQKLLTMIDPEREIVARDTKDHFLLFLQGDELSIEDRLISVMEDLRTYYHLHLKSNLLHFNAGVKMIGDGEEDVDALLSHALFALNEEGDDPEREIHFYDASLQDEENLANYAETYMYEALREGGFELFLQPQLDLHTKRVIRAEALVRWKLKNGTYLKPNQFIPVFERNGFCCELDLYMFEKVCQLMARWHKEGRQMLGISINQTRLLFYRDDYVPRLKALVAHYEIDPRWITIEMIESLMADLPDKIMQVVDQLREVGFRISLDDFGHGYSNFNTLQNYRVDELKLDKGFLSNDRSDTKRRELIVGGLVRLSRGLHIQTVMEGIENQADEDFVQIVGCDIGQGYYYDAPLAVSEFEKKYQEKVVSQ